MPVVVKLHFSLQVQNLGYLGKLEECFLGKKDTSVSNSEQQLGNRSEKRLTRRHRKLRPYCLFLVGEPQCEGGDGICCSDTCISSV